MAHFKLIPIDGTIAGTEYDAFSIATALDIVLRCDLGETDVYRDGLYKCTVSHGKQGVWIITQRKLVTRYNDCVRGSHAGSRPAALRPIAPALRLAAVA